MKRFIILFFLLPAVTVSAQPLSPADTLPKPAITEIGNPDGIKTDITIGKEGGSLRSSDGIIELTIPEGAVSKKTVFSIQPVVNLLPNGSGKAYRLEPSGTKFQKPLLLVFHYDPEEAEDSVEFLKSIAMQDDKGQWYGLRKFTLDTAAKTISGEINHFSVWATFDKLRLIHLPRSRKMMVNTSCMLFIIGVDRSPEEEASDDERDNDVGLLRISWRPPTSETWRVNNVIKGNTEFGTLAVGTMVASAIGNNYKAPANVPDWNPVTISVDLVGAYFKINGKVIRDLTLRDHVLIYDNAYEVTMEAEMDGYAGPRAGAIFYRDTGSFVVLLKGKVAKVVDRRNNNTTAYLKYDGGKCVISNEKEAAGTIDIGEVLKIIVIEATATQPANIQVMFKPTKLRLPLVKSVCPPIGRGQFTTHLNDKENAIIAAMARTLPVNVTFWAKQGEQVVDLLGQKGGGLYYKCTVKKLTDVYWE